MALPVDPDGRATRVTVLLEHNIRTELAIANDTMRLSLTPERIDDLVLVVTSSLESAFAVDWSPRWVAPGQVHSWHDGSWFARCSVCLEDSPGASTEDEAVAWALAHEHAHEPLGR